MSRPWSGVIAIEGRPTEDGRALVVDALRLPDDRPAVLVKLGNRADTPSADEIVGWVDRLTRDADGAVRAEGKIDWPTAERVESVAIDVSPFEAEAVDSRDVRIRIHSATLRRVVVNSPHPSWADRVGIDIT